MSYTIKIKDGSCKIKINDEMSWKIKKIEDDEGIGSKLSSACQWILGFAMKQDKKKKKKKKKDRFGKYFTEAQVEEWADKIRAKNTLDTRHDLKAIKKWIKQKEAFCSQSESRLHWFFNAEGIDFKSPNFDPCKDGSLFATEILLVSECLRRPGRPPGTNPDEIKAWSPWPWN